MQTYDALFTIGCLVCVFVLFYGPWQSLCVEGARQVIFEQREKLFDLAADGRLAFDSVEYRELRDYLNKSIRFSHHMTMWQFLANRAALTGIRPKNDEGPINRILRSIEDVEVRKKVAGIIDATAEALVNAMALRSMLVILLAGVAWLIQRSGFHLGLRRKRSQLEQEVRREVEIVPVS